MKQCPECLSWYNNDMDRCPTCKVGLIQNEYSHSDAHEGFFPKEKSRINLRLNDTLHIHLKARASVHRMSMDTLFGMGVQIVIDDHSNVGAYLYLAKSYKKTPGSKPRKTTFNITNEEKAKLWAIGITNNMHINDLYCACAAAGVLYA